MDWIEFYFGVVYQLSIAWLALPEVNTQIRKAQHLTVCTGGYPCLAEVDAFVNSLEEVVTYLEKEFPITGKLHFEPIVELRFFNGFRNLEIELETKLIYQLNSRTKVGLFYRYDPDSHVTTIHEAHSAGVGFNLAF